MPIYTRTGDEGETRLLFGGRVSKTDARCEAYGATDQAVSAMGLARALSNEPRVKDILLQVQREMFTVGAELATDSDHYENLKTHFDVVTPEMVTTLLVSIVKTRLALLPLMVRLAALGPVMLRFLLMFSCPFVRVMVPVTPKVMVSPESASAIVCRREPAPLSSVLVTVKISGKPDPTSNPSRGRPDKVG